MIFVVISGFMFVAAGVFVNGKQANTQFTQAVNDFDSELRQVVDDVNNGFYPSRGDFTCSAPSAGAVTLAATPKEQGTNQGCIFMGKVIHFGVGSANTPDYNVLSMTGRQFKDNSSEAIETLAQSYLMPIRDSGGTVDTIDRKTVPYGVEISRVYYTINGGSNVPIDIGAFGFFSSLAGYSNGLIQSGGQKLDLVAINMSNMTTSEATMNASASYSNLANIQVANDRQFVICLDGGNGRKASIAIGSNNGALSTNPQLGEGVAPGC
jgi:hypothetical protein